MDPTETKLKRGTYRRDRAPNGGRQGSVTPLRREPSRSSMAEALEESLAAAYWLASTDEALVMLLRDAVAEREQLRAGKRQGDRAALRQLERQIVSVLSLLGLDPRSRARFGAVVDSRPALSLIDELRAENNKRRNGRPPPAG